MNVIIVDDLRLFRLSLRSELSANPEINITGEADTGEAFLSMLDATPCDLVLLDIGLPDIDGVEIARRLRRNYPAVKILAISSENTKERVRDMLEIGIEGFISKQNGAYDEIACAIRNIMDGENYFGKDISTIMYQIYTSKNNPAAQQQPDFTPREKEIIELCREGFIAKEIATRLNISAYTVQNHKNNIFQKLGINTTMEMVQYALKHKIIRP